MRKWFFMYTQESKYTMKLRVSTPFKKTSNFQLLTSNFNLSLQLKERR